MMSYLWTNLAGRDGLASLWGSIESQFGELKYVFTLRDEWFRPRDLWPSVLPPNYLATETRPLGLLLLCLGAATFAMPNTFQIFGRFEPALGLPEETAWNGAARLASLSDHSCDVCFFGIAAFACQSVFVLSVLIA